MFILVSLVLIILVLLLNFLWKRRTLYKLGWSLDGKYAWPIIGNSLYFCCAHEALMDSMISLIQPYKSPGRFWLGPKLYVTVSDAENARILLSSPKMNQKDDVYRFMGDFLGNGLIAGSGESQRAHRKLIKPTLNQHILTSYIEVFDKQTQVLVKSMEAEVGKPAFDLIKYAHLCAVDVVMETLVDVKVNAQNNNNVELCHLLSRSSTLIHERMCKLWLHPDFIFYRTKLGKEQIYTSKTVRDFMQDAIDKKRAQILSTREQKPLEYVGDNITKKCTFGYLLEMVLDDPTVLTEKELLDEAATLVSASEDTACLIYSFTIMMLGMYPEYQNIAMQEIQEVFANSAEYTMTSLTNLKFIEMCIKEALRLIPIAPFIIRKVSEDFDLGPHKLPAGISCLISIYSLHFSKEHWEKPREFYPYHFLPEVVEKRHPCAWAPYSLGPRACLGKAYSMMFIKIMVVNTLKRFRVEADGKFKDLQMYADISCRVKGGCQVRLHYRN